MDLRVFKLKPLKRAYLNFLSLCVLITGASFILFRKGFRLFTGNTWADEFANIFLAGIIALAFAFSVYDVMQRKRIRSMPSLEEKIPAYEKFYRTRLWWHVIACASSGFLLLLVFRMIFFYFCVFDLLMMMLAWPARFRIRMDLAEDDLLFV